MTILLSKAFNKASALPESLQNELALEFLEEISREQRWKSALKKSASKIDGLAQQALKEHKQGQAFEIGMAHL